jgi:hypothetical protein
MPEMASLGDSNHRFGMIPASEPQSSTQIMHWSSSHLLFIFLLKELKWWFKIRQGMVFTPVF